MIVPMKHLTLLCVAGESGKALEALRDLGCVHVDLSRGSSNEFAEAKGELERAAEAVRTVQKAKREAPPKAGTAAVRRTVDDVRQLAAEREKAVSEADELRRQIALYEPYGDFDPELARSLIARGIDLSKVCELPDPLPKLRLSETKRLLAEAEAKVVALEAKLAATDETWITARNPELKDRVAFEAARDVLETQGAVSWIEGWVPVESVPRLRAKAVTKAWGLLLRDPEGDETPPTLIRPPKLFRPVAALFAGLGIAPGYTESDVSVPFMCYFSLFFAMLVGDGAYGLIFLAATLWGWRKTKPKEGVGHRPRVVRSWLTLLTVFSSATVVWGLLSNTWFGAGFPFAKDWPTVKWLADPSYSNMMLLCFTIGVSHLMLARIWSGIQIINDRGHIRRRAAVGILDVRRVACDGVWLHAEGKRAEVEGNRAWDAAAQHNERAWRHHQLRAPLRCGPCEREGGGELQQHGHGTRGGCGLHGPQGGDVRGDGGDTHCGARAQPGDGRAFDSCACGAPEHSRVLEPQGRVVGGIRI